LVPADDLAEYVVVTCEHGGNRVPPRYRRHFRGLQAVLQTHRGYDFGALILAQELSAAFKTPLVCSTVTRLVVDLNRSRGHPRLHGEPIRKLPREERESILAEHYRPYRARAESLIAKAVGRGQRVVHISAHSFTPELNGRKRTADVGLLYDPARPGEVRLAAAWKAALLRAAPGLRIRRNYPYAGTDDGFMPYLRTRFAPRRYLGVEIEINQALVMGARHRWTELRAAIIASLQDALASG
jgi:predicted N-formylglutamate amidohydrolase